MNKADPRMTKWRGLVPPPRVPDGGLLLLLIILAFLLVGGHSPHVQAHQVVAPCPFNSMCSCKGEGYVAQGDSATSDLGEDDGAPGEPHVAAVVETLRDVTCIGVPFSTMPELPPGQVSNVDVVSSGLEAIDNEALGNARVESLRLMSNRIQQVGEQAFSGMRGVLRSLDLSYNELDEIPYEALRSLGSLDWINLHSNQISSLTISNGHDSMDIHHSSDWASMRQSLTTLFLGDNDLIRLPHASRMSTDNGHSLSDIGGGEGPGGGGFLGPDGLGMDDGMGLGSSGHPPSITSDQASLAGCQALSWLNLDHNKLAALESGTLPESLQTLSASHNLITRFPAETIDGLKNLAWLFLRGNYLEAIPDYTFRHKKKLDKLDLGENALQSLPNNLFNGSLTVRDLNLDLNYIRSVPAQAFRGLNAGRIYLSMNRLEEIDDRAFLGLGHSLEFLDLEHNHLDRVPKALSMLKRLKYLYMPDNRISIIEEDAFRSFASTIRALSLSGNQLDRIPTEALQDCRRLSHLNIGYNLIHEVLPEDLAWAENLDTLLLRNNRIGRLGSGVFRHLTKLRELSLSFNKLSHVDPDAFHGLGQSLRSLEISFGLFREDFPADFLKPLSSLVWLALDNNNIRTSEPTALYSFPALQYLNLEANRLSELPEDFFSAGVHSQLRDIRLAYNQIEILQTHTFGRLSNLGSVVLTGNRIRNIRTQAFFSLPMFVTASLAENRVSTVEPRAFHSLPSLFKVDLQDNELKELSLGVFFNCTRPQVPMALNLSRNQLNALYPGDSGGNIYMKTIDLGRNRLTEIPVDFLVGAGIVLRRLHLGYNLLSTLHSDAFGPLQRLEVLGLEHNRLVTLHARCFRGLDRLQVIDLSHNHVEQLQTSQFSGMEQLRLLDLSHNHVRSLSRDVFRKTALERLDLSRNEFVEVPVGALSEIGATLRHLSLSHNHLEHLDSTMFQSIPHLLRLDLSFNKLTLLPDNVFTGAGGLLALDLSNNRLRANFKELFHYVQRLRELGLADTGLSKAPPLPLPSLLKLNLTRNLLDDISATSFEGLERLRVLDLSANRLQQVPSHVWSHLAQLKDLDLSRNPIKIITKESFHGLHRLQHLSLDHLLRLERFDADSLIRLKLLTQLHIQTWPRIEKYRFRLGSVLSAVPTLRRLTVTIQESVLNDQLIGAFNPKLKRLTLTGRNLRRIDSDALDGIENNHELLLEIRETSLEEVPAGMIARLERIPHLSLDLSDNRITSLAPATLYSNGSSWESVGTKMISGGLVLKGNPWQCECDLVWLGHWLRRWLRETLQIHTVAAEVAQRAARVARESECLDTRTGQRVALVDLDPEALACHASALSRGDASALGSPSALPWALVLLLCWLTRRLW